MKNICLLVAFFAITFLSAQSTYTVDNKPNAIADFDNLQTAINTVPAGSTLLVQGSPTSYGTLSIDKQITLKGTGYFLSENPFTQADFLSSKIANIYFNSGSSGSIITGFDCSGYIDLNEQVQPVSNITIIKNRIKAINGGSSININIFNNFIYSTNIGNNVSIFIGDGSVISGNYIQFAVKTTNAIISNNYMVNVSTADGSTYKNNIFWGTSSLSELNGTHVTSNIYNNIFYNSSVTTPTTDANNNKLTNQDPFIDSSNAAYTTDGRYKLKSGSVAAGAGVGGVDCGMFGGGYKLSGLPDIPAIYEFNVPNTGYSNSSGLQVNIKVKSNN